MSPDDRPYTTDDLSESELGSMALPDQVRYAIYNEQYYLSDIVALTTFSGEWTREIIEDMVDDGELREGSDSKGYFYTLPDEEANRGLSEEKRNDVHEAALAEYRSTATIGDDEDVTATMDASTDTSTADVEAHGKAATTSSTTSDDDTVSGPEPSEEDIAEARSKHGGRLPVDRDYDWESEKLDPSTVEEYVDASGMYDDIVKEIEDRRDTGKMAHFRMVGPTGCGKTLTGESIAVGMDAPCFIIQCHEGLRPNNLLGMPTYVGDETWWVDGPLPRALQCSNERPTVVIFDEVNRTTARTLGVIMSFLDHRASVTLNARGGETVTGDPMNLIVFSTMNQGDGYVTNQIDRAQLRRLGNTFETDYIGMHDVSEEAALIADRTPVSKSVAREMVEAANDIRQKANGDSNIQMGIPTSTMLDWARTAWSYRDDDPDGGPLIKAGKRSVLNTFFKGDEKSEDIVTTTLESHLRGMDLDYEETMTTDDDDDDDESDESIELDDDTWLMCDSCGFYTDVEDADSSTVTTMECPECSDTIVPKEAT